MLCQLSYESWSYYRELNPGLPIDNRRSLPLDHSSWWTLQVSILPHAACKAASPPWYMSALKELLALLPLLSFLLPLRRLNTEAGQRPRRVAG